MITYRVTLDVPLHLVIKVSNLLRKRRKELGTRNGTRALTCYQPRGEGMRVHKPVIADGEQALIRVGGQQWLVSWHPPQRPRMESRMAPRASA